jgi:glutamine---fructose-6-phosphate transaminase (isomerizing)
MSQIEKEIYSQPIVLDRLLTRESRRVRKIGASIKRSGVRTVFMVARGSSDNAGLYGKYLFGARNGLVTAMATPSLFTLYKQPPDLSGCLVLAISQSGASDDLSRVLDEARRQGSRRLVITNTPASPLAKLADDVIPLHAGVEKSVAATKSYTAQLLSLSMLSAALRVSQKDFQALARVPQALQSVLDGAKKIAASAERYRYMQRLAVIGRGYNYATAFELALKLKELAYLNAEPSSSADFRHGPIAVVEDGFPVLLIAPRGKTMADMRALVESLSKRRAELIVISDNAKLRALAKTPLACGSGLPEWLSPMLAVVPGQLFAMHLAAARGCPLDKPRGLSKVTITR